MARILIVDDSPTQMLSMSKILQRHGHEILTAEDGEDGVVKAHAEHPDLILMDVVMPKLNGFQATRKLATEQDTQNIPVVLVTTKDQETDRIWGKRQGAREYLIKPVNESELITTVNRLLGG